MRTFPPFSKLQKMCDLGPPRLIMDGRRGMILRNNVDFARMGIGRPWAAVKNREANDKMRKANHVSHL
jgi:hypothetical protein